VPRSSNIHYDPTGDVAVRDVSASVGALARELKVDRRSYCGSFIIQTGMGRPRKTCSNVCRRKLYQAGGSSWKDDYQFRSRREFDDLDRRNPANTSPLVANDAVQAIMRPFRASVHDSARVESDFIFWWQSDIRFRDRALLLLGLKCPVSLNPRDLASLDVDDIAFRPTGLEVRLHRRSENPTRYVIMPPNADKELCVVEAISAWRTRIMRTGRTLGPLFVRLDDRGHLSNVDTKLTSVAVASIIENAVMPANVKHLPQLTPQTYISEYLY